MKSAPNLNTLKHKHYAVYGIRLTCYKTGDVKKLCGDGDDDDDRTQECRKPQRPTTTQIRVSNKGLFKQYVINPSTNSVCSHNIPTKRDWELHSHK